jgi:hypothetical protein
MRLSEAGRLLAGALELDWAVRCGLQVRWDEVSYPDFVRLRILQEERHKKEVEDIERDRDQQERDRKWAQRRGK